MARKLKVYQVMGCRQECPAAPNGSRQTSEIVATTSKARAIKLFGCSAYQLNNFGGETGNAESCAIALASPETVFWRPNSAYNAPWSKLGG